jgi:hypothetical protein
LLLTLVHAMANFHVSTGFIAEAFAELINQHGIRQRQIQVMHERQHRTIRSDCTLGPSFVRAHRSRHPPRFVHAIERRAACR